MLALVIIRKIFLYNHKSALVLRRRQYEVVKFILYPGVLRCKGVIYST